MDHDPTLDLLGGLSFVDDAGQPLVLQLTHEPHPATQRLMDSLGVRVEVGAVSVVEEFVVTCASAGCEKVPRPGAAYCRAHTPVAELRHERDGLAALQRMDAGEPQTRTATVDVKQPSIAPARMATPETEDTNVDTQKAAPATSKWTQASIIAGIQAKANELGRQPTKAEAGSALNQAAAKSFGTWADAVVAAGYERPTRAFRTPKAVLAEREPKAGEAAVAPAVSRGDSASVTSPAAVVVPVASPEIGLEAASRSANTEPPENIPDSFLKDAAPDEGAKQEVPAPEQPPAAGSDVDLRVALARIEGLATAHRGHHVTDADLDLIRTIAREGLGL